MKICETNECTGCSACMNICPTNSISMEENIYGEVYPSIDVVTCINCKKCVNTCPNNKKQNFVMPQHVYAASRNNATKLLNSASGGIGAVLAEKWIIDGGIVCGTRYDQNFKPYIRMENDLSGIEAFKGSKYVQSSVGFIYNKVKKLLEQGKKVLFFGTPCQIAGLYSIVDKNNPNVTTVEILCHGVSPFRYFREELVQLRKEHGFNTFDNVTFRTNQWMLDFYFTIWNNGKPIYEKQAYENRYFSAFLSGLSLRESCYQCHYKNKERLGDVLIGDFIGLGKKIPYAGNPGHKSLVMCMTKKGYDLYQSCYDRLESVERTIEEAVIEGRSLREPFPKHPNREQFRKLVKKDGFISAANSILGKDISEREKKNKKMEIKRRIKLWLKYTFHIRIEYRKIYFDD